MKVRPVRSGRKPHYPTAEEFGRKQEEIRIMPLRWVKNSTAAAAFGMLLVMTACERQETQETLPEEGGNCAPVFVHGEGYGWLGCVAVTAPLFFSEEEALAIILDEARTYGELDFQAEETSVIDGILFPAEDGGKTEVSLALDGKSPDGNITFEFVSLNDLEKWGQITRDETGGASYEIQETAKILQSQLGQREDSVKTGVFYDPYDYEASFTLEEQISQENPQDDFEELQRKKEEAVIALSEENLRAQVRDFIDWLKGQGVI